MKVFHETSHIFDMIPKSLDRLFSFHGLYEVLSIGGIWNLIIIGGLVMKKYRLVLKNHLSHMWWLLVVVVLIQALLSYELARMFYLLTPILAVVVAIIFDGLSSEASRTTSG